MKNVKSDIAGYLRNYLDEINQINLNDEDFLNFRYLDSGHIDSFEIMHLIVNIEQEFNIRIEAEDTESDEFRYIEGLVEMIEKKL
ncbi:acyl carrier protein [bacterium]|jgi:acyl carrier protein|nr:acyl carrier protein [bacterium]